jgi:2'-5' RNA ligase superfamily protein
LSAHEFTTLFGPVAAAEPVVADIRLEHDWPAGEGVPAHVTLLGPFLPPQQITDGVIERAGQVVGRAIRPSFSLTEVRRVADIAYLAVEPDDGLRAVTAELEEAFPQAPRYGEEFGGPLYHVTIARECGEELFAKIADRLAPSLPILATVEEVVLVEHGDQSGTRLRARFPLGLD